MAGNAGTPAKISACRMMPLQKKSIVVISINNASRVREDVLNHREFPVPILKKKNSGMDITESEQRSRLACQCHKIVSFHAVTGFFYNLHRNLFNCVMHL